MIGLIGRNARSCERRSAQRRAEFRSLPFGIFIFFLIVGSASPSHAQSERSGFFQVLRVLRATGVYVSRSCLEHPKRNDQHAGVLATG